MKEKKAEQVVKKICKDCKFYEKPTCVKHNKFTARKQSCENFEKR